MNDYEYTFRTYSAEKKNVANSARHKTGTRGGRSCRLPSDNMTKAQWTAKNGKVYSITLFERHTWSKFKSLPTSLQVEYLKALIDNYNPRNRDVAAFFGATPNTFSAYCRKNLSEVKFTNLSKTPSHEWLEYLRRLENIEKGLDEPNHEEELTDVSVEAIDEEPVEFVPNEVEEITVKKAVNKHGELTFKGNPIAAFKRMEALFDADKEYTISIYYKEEDDVSEEEL